MRKRVISMLLSAMMITSVVPSVTASADEVKADEVVRLNPSNASPFNNGEFEGWGTSMGWWGNRIGYSDAMAKQAAELFYSEDGLGMDIVRYNVGGGDDPTHNHVTRSYSKLPCLAIPEFEENGTTLKKDENGDVVYTYNWDNDHNQVNVLKEIKKANDNVHIEGYTNSPPWFMTKSGCSGGGTNAGDENLDPSNYDVFAKFLGDVTEHFAEIGLKFDSYSPMNEPNPATKYWTALNAKQEGNLVAVGANQSGVINALSNEYDSRGIDTLVVGLDETSIDYSITSYNALTAEAKANLDRLDTHTYGGSKRAELKQTAINAGKNLWMSEVDGGWDGFGLAERIILDLNEMQSSAWVLWDIVDFHKDSNFTDPSGNKTEANAYINPDGSMWGMAMGNHDTQNIELSMKYYAYGQFTKYINPGDTLIASSDSTLAAYNKETGTIKVVALNNSASAKTYKFDMSAFGEVGENVKVIRTSGTFADGEKWASLADAKVEDKTLTYELPAKSITTFVVENDLKLDETPVAVNKFEATSTQLSYSYNVSEEYADCNKYFVVYDAEGKLQLVTLNDSEKTISGNFAGSTFKLFVWDGMKPEVTPVKTVSEIPYIFVSGTDMTIAGQDYQYKAATSDGSTVTWSVSDETMATINENGLLTPLKSGTVLVTATSETAGTNSMEVYICAAPKIDVTSSMVSGTKSWNDTASTVAAMAADGSLTTFFDGLNAGYVVIDLQNEYDIEMIGYAPRAGYEYRMIDGSFYVSNDNATWTEIYKVSEKPASNSLTYVMGNDLKVPEGTYRYVKYAVPSGKQSYNGKEEDYNCNIAEIVIYGTEAELTSSEKVERAIANLEIPETVYGNLNMPTSFGDVKVEWTSSDANVITTDGIVTRGAEDTALTLTAVFSLAGVTEAQTYNVTVKKAAQGKEEEDMEAYLFVHFVGTEATEDDEQIYFSVSQDGTTWRTLNEGTPVLTSNVGEKGVRDP
ncbi:MAG: discoidin domain-containing protein, partial [Clostridia bacterium]|nr:discoidin domain-containing protein [Clostridia bacterium]